MRPLLSSHVVPGIPARCSCPGLGLAMCMLGYLKSSARLRARPSTSGMSQTSTAAEDLHHACSAATVTCPKVAPGAIKTCLNPCPHALAGRLVYIALLWLSSAGRPNHVTKGFAQGRVQTIDCACARRMSVLRTTDACVAATSSVRGSSQPKPKQHAGACRPPLSVVVTII